MVKTYIKKPCQIHAVEFKYTQECLDFLKEWMGSEFKEYGKSRNPNALGWLHVGTLEDGNILSKQVQHIAFEGDYIIKGIKGEFYPCKKDIFELSYQEFVE
jgi:hypothetical protein